MRADDFVTRRRKCICAYDGTGFAGWQSQAAGRGLAIQDVIEARLEAIFGQPVRIAGSGRTDALRFRSRVLGLCARTFMRASMRAGSVTNTASTWAMQIRLRGLIVGRFLGHLMLTRCGRPQPVLSGGTIFALSLRSMVRPERTPYARFTGSMFYSGGSG